MDHQPQQHTIFRTQIDKEDYRSIIAYGYLLSQDVDLTKVDQQQINNIISEVTQQQFNSSCQHIDSINHFLNQIRAEIPHEENTEYENIITASVAKHFAVTSLATINKSKDFIDNLRQQIKSINTLLMVSLLGNIAMLGIVWLK